MRHAKMREAHTVVFNAGTDYSGQADKLIELGFSPTEAAGTLRDAVAVVSVHLRNMPEVQL